jgi:hypothetical protein
MTHKIGRSTILLLYTCFLGITLTGPLFTPPLFLSAAAAAREQHRAPLRLARTPSRACAPPPPDVCAARPLPYSRNRLHFSLSPPHFLPIKPTPLMVLKPPWPVISSSPPAPSPLPSPPSIKAATSLSLSLPELAISLSLSPCSRHRPRPHRRTPSPKLHRPRNARAGFRRPSAPLLPCRDRPTEPLFADLHFPTLEQELQGRRRHIYDLAPDL